ncbi:hypothetical protein K8R66_00875 [bacterium]|nr:hypothetical protein [bacterium]
MSTKLSSDTLFHYTTSFDIIKKILTEGFKPNYSLENFEFLFEEVGNIKNHHFIPMVCFCDLPISSAKEYIFKDRKYAIGLSKEWGEVNGLNPVMYISRNSKVIKNFRYAYSKYTELDIEIEKEKNQLLDFKYEDLNKSSIAELSKKYKKVITEKDIEEAKSNLVRQICGEDLLLGYSHSLNDLYDDLFYKNDMIKKRIYKLLMIANNAIKFILFLKPYSNKAKTIKYYDEKEWRYVPDVSKQLIECQNEVVKEVEEKGKNNSKLFQQQVGWMHRFASNTLKFSPSDLRYIIVSDEDKNELIEFLMSSKYKDDYLLNKFIILTYSQIMEDL